MRSAALLLVALAGCVAPAAPPGPAEPDFSPPASLALRPDGALGEVPALSVVGLQWGWRQWLDGTAPPTWTGRAAAQPYLVLNATATVLYQARDAVSGTERRPELTVWWGIDRSFVHHAFLDGPNTLAPGETFEAVFDLELPRGGLVVPAGARPFLQVGTYYTDDAQRGAVAVRLGDAAAVTRLDLVARPLDLPEAADGEPAVTRGELLGGRCLSLDALTDRDMVEIPLDLAGAAGVRLLLERAGGSGPPDLDFSVVDAAGEVVGRSQGSGAQEELLLREVNLAAAPHPWTLRVYSCTPQAASFVATVTPLRAR